MSRDHKENPKDKSLLHGDISWNVARLLGHTSLGLFAATNKSHRAIVKNEIMPERIERIRKLTDLSNAELFHNCCQSIELALFVFDVASLVKKLFPRDPRDVNWVDFENPMGSEPVDAEMVLAQIAEQNTHFYRICHAHKSVYEAVLTNPSLANQLTQDQRNQLNNLHNPQQQGPQQFHRQDGENIDRENFVPGIGGIGY